MRIRHAVFLAGLALAAGCFGPRIEPGGDAYVDVSSQGVVRFAGKATTLNDLPDVLRRAGAKAGTPVKIVPDSPEVSSRLLKSIANGLNRQWFSRVMIVGERRASVIVDGAVEEAPAGGAGAR